MATGLVDTFAVVGREIDRRWQILHNIFEMLYAIYYDKW